MENQLADMIVLIDSTNIHQAAEIHSVAWQESHRFCSPAFIEMHTPERQKEYLQTKIDSGSSFYMLVEGEPIGIVSIKGNLIEDLYIHPDRQHQGFGAKMLRFAIEKCSGTPTLWVLENNIRAQAFYHRAGFEKTGRISAITGQLKEIEMERRGS